jgi:hypothetical protein
MISSDGSENCSSGRFSIAGFMKSSQVFVG